MNRTDCSVDTRAATMSDDQYYEALREREIVDSGPDYRFAYLGPCQDLATALVRINCTDDDAPELGPWDMAHSELIEPRDWADELTLARWLYGHGAGWVIRRGLLGRVQAMLRERWEHRLEYMERFEPGPRGYGHGRAPLAPRLRALAEMAK